MSKVLWLFQILLALAFLLAGVPKVLLPLPDLISQGMLWIEDFPAWQVRAIGALEALGAVGLIAPHFIKALPRVLVALSAAGLALTMVGAIATHILRSDPALSIIITTVMFAMCAFVAYQRMGEKKKGELASAHA